MWIWRSNSVSRPSVDTIIDFAAAAKHGVKTEGNSAAAVAVILVVVLLWPLGRLPWP